MPERKASQIPDYFIDRYIRPACHDDSCIVEAFKAVPRELFMDEAMRLNAYNDNAQPIGFGQTISQPSLVAMMLYKLEIRKTDKCLEIGAGSGFVTALLSKLAGEVFALELLPELRVKAQEKISEMKIDNARLFTADGTLGFPEKAPYDRIIISAGAKSLPPALIEQLTDEGIMIIPLNGVLTKIINNKGLLTKQHLANVTFVDFVNS